MNAPTRKVLVVDDNRLYREAIRRNLEFVDYDVLEAENLKTALEEIRTRRPQVIVTDLDMTTRTEGLDLIREVKVRYPLIPVILVSAVGTFEEGAQAQELGATAVLSKSRIDEELEHLYACLDEVFDQISMISSLRGKVDRYLQDTSGQESPSKLEEEFNQLMGSIKFDTSIKGELYDWLSQIKDRQLLFQRNAAAEAAPAAAETAPEAGVMEAVEEKIGNLDLFDPETQSMLVTAEQMMQQVDPNVDSGWARNVGFSYSFAVENEVKQRLGKRLAKLVVNPDSKKAIGQLYDRRSGGLSLGISRYLLLTQPGSEELSQDLVRQILERMARHETKYKADGLKALGVICYLFGRKHEFDDLGSKVVIDNPLGLKGLTDEETTQFGILLIRLQHTRNPFIHPEFSEREKLTVMRELVIDCLNLVKKIEE